MFFDVLSNYGKLMFAYGERYFYFFFLIKYVVFTNWSEKCMKGNKQKQTFMKGRFEIINILQQIHS